RWNEMQVDVCSVVGIRSGRKVVRGSIQPCCEILSCALLLCDDGDAQRHISQCCRQRGAGLLSCLAVEVLSMSVGQRDDGLPTPIVALMHRPFPIASLFAAHPFLLYLHLPHLKLTADRSSSVLALRTLADLKSSLLMFIRFPKRLFLSRCLSR